RAAGDDDLSYALRAQVLRCEGADLAGAHDEHPAAVEAPENLAGQGDRGKADRDRALTEPRLRAHALADAKRGMEQPREQGPGTLARGGDLKRLLDLSENLRLADDERIEPGRHPEQV